MSAFTLQDAATVALGAPQPWPAGRPPVSGTPMASELVLSDDGTTSVGIWEATAGSWQTRADGYTEVMTFVSGSATITVDDGSGTVLDIRPGVVLSVSDGWRGTWVVTEPVRKVFCITVLPDASPAT